MNQNLVNQYVYKINEVKLQQDLEIMKNIKRDFDNRFAINEKKFQEGMMSSCKKFQKEKGTFQACKTFNNRLIQRFKEYGKQIAIQSEKSYDIIRHQLRENAFRSFDLQRFNLVVDYEMITENQLKTLEEESLRTKVKKFTLNDMR